MGLSELHDILFNMQAMYSFGIGIFAVVLVARHTPGESEEGLLTGGFWGAVVIYVILNVVVFVLGVILWAQGFTISSGGRIGIYVLYMAFLIVIMPGLFSMLRGRDDLRAGWYFAALAVFNASVSLSAAQRGLMSWVETL